MKAIYRFRSADKLLDDQYSEFTRIYLADRESLNDPMEGFFNITFNGDKILWANLFKHFFQSIWFIWSIFRIKHGRHSLSAQDVVIGDHDNWSDDFFYKEEYTNFETYWERFCDINEMNPIFERLEKCTCPINIAILEIVFTITSPYAMHHVGLLGESGIDPKKIKLSKLLNQIVDGIENDTDTFEHKHDSISAVSKYAIAKRYGKDSIYSKLSKNDAFLLIDFTSHFIDKLVYLCTPYVRLASFSKVFTNPLTWSHYADGNKGGCLIFNKDVDYKLQSTNESLRFYPVCYDLETTRLNFFSTLFRINRAQAINRWQSGDVCPNNGSKLFNRILYPYFHKLGAWGYEEEERLLVDDFMRDDKAIDVVNIDQSHIKGVIFGARMHYGKEIAIREKAKELGLNSVKFYHAVWSEHNRGIKVFDDNGDEYIEDTPPDNA